MLPDLVEDSVGDAIAAIVDRLEMCLARLAERERMVVLLTFYAERTAGEVGKELGVKEGNVRVIRHRAVERLRTCMTSREGGADDGRAARLRFPRGRCSTTGRVT